MLEVITLLTSDNDDAPANIVNSHHSIPRYQLLDAYIAVSGNKMTITNIILTNQRRPYKLELQHLQQKLDKIDMSYHYRRCVRNIGLVKCKKSFQIFKNVMRQKCYLFYQFMALKKCVYINNDILNLVIILSECKSKILLFDVPYTEGMRSV